MCDWKGLLNWSLNYHDGTKPSEFKPMSEEDKKVLIFCQMTHMIDILEEYMSKKKYTYFRMDGSTQIADRRDMINEFQTNPKVFAFLLS